MQVRSLPALWGRTKQRFGAWQPIAFLCSSIAIFGCFAALASLWAWDSHKTTGLRHEVAVAGRMPTVIAVISAILRTAISVQLGICCMMFATLAFEYKAVQLRDAAAMSIYRYSASSPYPLILPVLRGARLKWAGIGPSVLLVLLSALSIATQLLSAILLTDTDLAPIPDSVRATPVSDALARFRPSQENDGLWCPITMETEPPFPKFVEEAGDGYARSEGPNGRGLVDSGTLKRALIPLNSSDISSLVYYKGPALAFDLHTICVSPQLQNLSLSYSDTDRSIMKLKGNISAVYPTLEGVAGGAKFNGPSKWSDLPSTRKTNLRGTISCRPPTNPGRRYSNPQGPFFPCLVELGVGGAGGCEVGRTCSWKLAGYLIYLLRFNKTNSRGDLTPAAEEVFNKYNGTEWADLEFSQGGNQIKMEATLCIMDPTIRYATIETNLDPRNLSQPRLESVWQQDSMIRNYSSVWTQLGEGSSSRKPKDRGVFEFRSNEFPPTNFSIFWRSYDTKQTIAPLYSEILADYRKPISQRLQSLVWLGFSSYFYARVDSSPATSAREAQAIHLRTHIVPVRTRGFTIVGIIAAVHMISVVLIFYLFFTTNIPKFLDQAWQTIGQLHAGSAKEIIEKCGTAGDQEVAKWREVEGKWDSPVGFFVEKRASTEEGKKVAIGCMNVSKTDSEAVETFPTTALLKVAGYELRQDD